MTTKFPLPKYIPDDEHSVSLKEATRIANDSKHPVYSLFSILDIVEQFVVINDRYYYKETLIRVFPTAKEEKT